MFSGIVRDSIHENKKQKHVEILRNSRIDDETI